MKTILNKKSVCFFIFFSFLLIIPIIWRDSGNAISGKSISSNNETTTRSQTVTKIIDHTCIDITRIPQLAINQAKQNLHIAFGATSHGWQLTAGMESLVEFANRGGLNLKLPNNIFQIDKNGNGGGTYLHLFVGSGYTPGNLEGDAGYYPGWVNATNKYLGLVDSNGRGSNHPEINVIIWSWCWQVAGKTEKTMITEYLEPMSKFERMYPGITFIYMTGHLNGTGLKGNLHLRNEQIRTYCKINNKWLYDFADIETYDPDGKYYGDQLPTDGCNYDYNKDGKTNEKGAPAEPINGDRNWATDWQIKNPEKWYKCFSPHTKPLNANLKAYAAWWLWARLAGWSD
jgi:hypothetical protein